jgi:multiple sugar transport system permease protein
MKNISMQVRKDRTTAYLMLAPVVILLTIFVVIPLIYAIFVSFYQWNFYKASVFVGFENFRRVLVDDLFYKSMWIGIKFALIVIPLQFVLAFLLANALKSMKGKFGGIVKTSIYVPNVISGVVASIIFIFIYDYQGGFANWFLDLIHIPAVTWLADVKYALPSIAVPAIWIGFGVTTLIMLAGLNDIPDSYYEAAEIDGATGFHKMFYITLPLMKNVFLYVFVTGITAAIQQFDLPFMMTGGGPLSETTTPNLFIYNHFKSDPYLGYTISASLLLFVFLGAISGFIFKAVNSEKNTNG